MCINQLLRQILCTSFLFLLPFSLYAASCSNPINLVTATGQSLGNVTATYDPNNNNSLIVSLHMDPGYTLQDSKVQAGLSSSDIALLFNLNKQGNPEVGKFPSKHSDNGAGASIHTISGSFTPNANIYLAVQATVKKPNAGGTTTVWAAGTQFNAGKNWASYAQCMIHQNPVAMDDSYSWLIPDPQAAMQFNAGKLTDNDTGNGPLTIVIDQGLTFDDPAWGSDNGKLVSSVLSNFVTISPNCSSGCDGSFTLSFNPVLSNGLIGALPPFNQFYSRGSFKFTYHTVDATGVASNTATVHIQLTSSNQVLVINYSPILSLSNSNVLIMDQAISFPTSTEIPIVESKVTNSSLGQVTYTVIAPNTSQTVNLEVINANYIGAPTDTAVTNTGTLTFNGIGIIPQCISTPTNPCPVSGYNLVTKDTQSTSSGTQTTTATSFLMNIIKLN